MKQRLKLFAFGRHTEDRFRPSRPVDDRHHHRRERPSTGVPGRHDGADGRCVEVEGDGVGQQPAVRPTAEVAP